VDIVMLFKFYKKRLCFSSFVGVRTNKKTVKNAVGHKAAEESNLSFNILSTNNLNVFCLFILIYESFELKKFISFNTIPSLF
jgi:hypothetical protein